MPSCFMLRRIVCRNYHGGGGGRAPEMIVKHWLKSIAMLCHEATSSSGALAKSRDSIAAMQSQLLLDT